MQPIGGSPIIEYPTDWSYTLLGWDEAEIRAAVGEIIPTTEHTLCFSHRSKRGTYCSLELVIEVVTEEERLDLYTRLGEHEAIRMVL